MISLAKAGRRVVRLKAGDPMIFGRADEEIFACRAAGIPVEIVPGIAVGKASPVFAKYDENLDFCSLPELLPRQTSG